MAAQLVAGVTRYHLPHPRLSLAKLRLPLLAGAFAGEFGDNFIDGTDLEGGHTEASLSTVSWLLPQMLREQSGVLHGVLEASEEVGVKRVGALLEEALEWGVALHDAHTPVEYAGFLAKWMARVETIRAGPAGECVLLPGGWCTNNGGHAIMHVLERSQRPLGDGGEFIVVTLNTGQGVGHHPGSSKWFPKEKRRTAIRLLADAERVVDPGVWFVLWQQMREWKGVHGPRVLYESLLPHLAGDVQLQDALRAAEASGVRQGEWETPQKTGTCYYRCVLCALRYLLRECAGLNRKKRKHVTLALRLQYLAVMRRQAKIAVSPRLGFCEDAKWSEVEASAAASEAAANLVKAPSSSAVHVGFACDVSGVSPIVGARYHRRGANFDVCAAEFAKLSATEQAKYDCIVAPGATPFAVGAAAAEKEGAASAGAVPPSATAPVKLRRSEMRLMLLGVSMSAYHTAKRGDCGDLKPAALAALTGMLSEMEQHLNSRLRAVDELDEEEECADVPTDVPTEGEDALTDNAGELRLEAGTPLVPFAEWPSSFDVANERLGASAHRRYPFRVAPRCSFAPFLLPPASPLGGVPSLPPIPLHRSPPPSSLSSPPPHHDV